jgi:hypothetical protein
MSITNEQIDAISKYRHYEQRLAPREEWNESTRKFVLEQEQKALDVMSTILTFTTKDEYLEWVKQWKAQYTALSKEIRTHKNNRKTTQPNFDYQASSKARVGGWRATTLLYIRGCSKRRAAHLREIRLAALKQEA